VVALMAQVTISTGRFVRGLTSRRPFRHLDVVISRHYALSGLNGFKLHRVEYPWWDYRGLDWPKEP
jgi:hypothetical protein